LAWLYGGRFCWSHSSICPVSAACCGGGLTFILLSSFFFIRGRLLAYQRLTESVAEVQRVMVDRPADEGILLVNLPNWLAPARSQYPVGVELVSMLGGYLFVEELMAQNLPADHPV
jgi:hypothetical protein